MTRHTQALSTDKKFTLQRMFALLYIPIDPHTQKFLLATLLMYELHLR